MPLHTIARTLGRRTCPPPHFLPLLRIIHDRSALHSPSPYSHSCNTLLPPLLNALAGAFRRPSIGHFQKPRPLLLRLFSAQICCHPFDFDPQQVLAEDSQGLKFIEVLKCVAQLPSETEAVESLENSEVVLSRELVCWAVWALRDEWRLAFLAFKWGEKRGCIDRKAFELMIWVLGNHQKFNIAWCLIRDLHGASLDSRRAMLIMIDRYASANNPAKAIWTFHTMEKFRTAPDEEAYRTVITSLCRNGNIEEAEEFMLLNKQLFPLETDSFNIILYGWCTISVDVLEAKRIWRKMSECCIIPNATSYTHMIYCFSRVGNLFDSLRLYDEMKKRGWVPGLEVYNSLIYVLTSQNCFPEALKMLEKLKGAGLQPDHGTYDLMIRPLCELRKMDEARVVLSSMIGDNIEPTIETYHSFLKVTSFEETLELLSRMRKAGLGPNEETFLLILEKFFELKQVENALKIWIEMRQYETVPLAGHYTKMVQGLVTSGYLTKAKEIYSEMRAKGYLDDPKLKKLLYKSRRDKKEGYARQNKGDTQVHLRKGTMVKFKKVRRSSNRERRRIASWDGTKANAQG